MPETPAEERLETRRGYEDSITDVTNKLRGEFRELQSTGDEEALLTLHMTALSALVGFDKMLDDDEDMQEYEDETEEELRAKGRAFRTLEMLADLAGDIEEEIDGLGEGKPATVTRLADHLQKRAG